MLDKINPLQNINVIYKKNFRGNEQNKVTAPERKIVEANSLMSLANYNLGTLQWNNVINTMATKPFDIPDDVNQIKGERIYNSDNKLEEIVDEDERYITRYEIGPNGNNNKCYKITKIDKSTGIMYAQTNFEKDRFSVIKKLPDGKCYETTYLGGKVCEFKETDKNQKFSRNIFNSFGEDYSIKQEFIDYNGNLVERWADFDKKGHCTNLREQNDNKTEWIEIDSLNKEHANVRYEIDNPIDMKNIDLTNFDLSNLKPDEKIDFKKEDIEKLDGYKTYYSNGNIESLTTQNGDKYLFTANGTLYDVKKDNIRYHFIRDCFENDEIDYYSISKTFDNGDEKNTTYYKDGTIELNYRSRDGKFSKGVVYTNGKIKNYFDNNMDILFDKNENIIRYQISNKIVKTEPIVLVHK